MTYRLKEKNFTGDDLALEKAIDLLRKKKSFAVITKDNEVGIILIDEDLAISQKAELILAALNAPEA